MTQNGAVIIGQHLQDGHCDAHAVAAIIHRATGGEEFRSNHAGCGKDKYWSSRIHGVSSVCIGVIDSYFNETVTAMQHIG